VQYRIVDKHSTYKTTKNYYCFTCIYACNVADIFVLSFGILVCISCGELAVVIVLKCMLSSRRKLVGQRRDQNRVPGRSFVWMEDLF